jgi:ABC-type multidrug transport system ATPase subunit
MLGLDRVSKRYGRKLILDRVEYDFAPGLTLLVGPSGAGKSTLLRLLATAERPSCGTITWQGESLPRSRATLRRALGYAPQAVDLPEDLTAREFAMHVAALKDLELKTADSQFLNITDAIGLHADVNNRIATFSGGMRRRLILAQALLGSPKLLILDEPTAELDHETTRRVGDLILERARDAIVIVTTHIADALLPKACATLRVDNRRVVPA